MVSPSAYAKKQAVAQINTASTTPTELSTITVFGNSAADSLAPSAQTAENLLHKWPGNVGLITESDYDQRAVLGLSDALVSEPGVFARSTAGQQSVKLSIRGSGLASPLGLRGITLLRDGLPLNQADGVVDPS